MSRSHVPVAAITAAMGLTLAASSVAAPAAALPTAGVNTTTAGTVAHPVIHRWECWDPGNPNPCHRDLLALDALSPTEAWVVGSDGIILRGDGIGWSAVPADPSWYLQSVDLLSPSDGWAVGTLDADVETIRSIGGVPSLIAHWDGLVWADVRYHNNLQLTVVSMATADSGWAAGYRSNSDTETFDTEIIHWDGSSWTTALTLPGEIVRDIDMVSPADGWAAGSRWYHWDGVDWRPAGKPDEHYVTALDMVDADDGWSLAECGGPRLGAYHWDGTAWSTAPSAAGLCLRDVSMAARDRGWAIGGRDPWTSGTTLYEWDGRAWVEAPAPRGPWLRSVAAASRERAWSVGYAGEILAWDGRRWERSAPPIAARSLRGLAFAGARYGWAGGDRGAMFHWDGTAWRSRPVSDTIAVNAIDLLSDADGFAVGITGGSEVGAVALRWDARQWAASTLPDAWRPAAVDALTASDAWLVGDSYGAEPGGLVAHWDGLAWSRAPGFGLESQFFSISAVGTADVWAGDRGALAHWDGATWRRVPAVVDGYSRLTGLSLAGPTDGWAVTDYDRSVQPCDSVLLSWNGSEWQPWSAQGAPTEGGPYCLADVDVRVAGDAWAVGTDVVHWDGREWSAAFAPRVRLNNVAAVSETDGWAVGESGVFLRYRPSAGAASVYVPLADRRP